MTEMEVNMCAIMGYTANDFSREQLEKAFVSLKHRGPDSSRTLQTAGGTLLFHRLSIMGPGQTGMQPFTGYGCAVACNGELYGFRKKKSELEARGYRFQSKSDCEILIPLWREYGTGMFRYLDAEFAFILYDSRQNTWLAARDPIGIRPLYYGYSPSGHILFASEPQALLPLVQGQMMPFPPGHYYLDGKFHIYEDIALPRDVCQDDLETIFGKIRSKLTAAVEKRLDADVPVGFLLSGGLDSSLVCAIEAKSLGRPIETYAIGMQADAIDLKYAREVARHIGSHHHEVYITSRQAVDALETVIATLGTYDITTIRASIGMYLLCQAIHQQSDIRVLLTGEVSDELFGYKYTDFAPSASAFQDESEKRIRQLHMYDVLRADRCIAAHSMEARVPFGDLELVRYIMALDPEKKRNVYGKGKYLLRQAFVGGLLPESIRLREKAAFSDAVGHSLVEDLKALAEQMYGNEWKTMTAQYDFAMPFTKESLLYRQIFEKYYPGQAPMVAGFWMPNTSWQGCDVGDPSSRYLSNYGDSSR